MAKHSILAIAHTRTHADTMYDELLRAGFSSHAVSVICPDPRGKVTLPHDETKAPEGAVAGASAGSVAGGALGLLAGVGLLVIPGIGPLLGAGPLVATLSGLAFGAAVGSFTGALIGLGIPEQDASRYEERLRGGGLLVSVHVDTLAEIEHARAVMARKGATDISTSADSRKTPQPSRPAESRRF